MKIRMKTIARGPSFEADVGQVLEVPETFGRELLAGGYAETLEVAALLPAAGDVKTAAVLTTPKERKARAKPEKPKE